MARARTDRTHPNNVLAEIDRLTDTDREVLRLVAEHEVMSTEQLAALCFPRPDRVADAGQRLRYLATRALLVRFPYPGTHPAGLPASEPNDATPGGLPGPVAPRWNEGQRWAWSLGQGGAYWAGVERALNRDRWIEAWSRSFVPHERPHVRRRLALNDFFAALHHGARDRDYVRLDQWWGPARCTDISGGKTAPDAHGRWRYADQTVPFWIYSDSVRHPFRHLITTVERHQTAHRTEQDVIVLVMVNDNRERHLHRRWTDLAVTSGVTLPPVATTSYRKLRAWPTGTIWWPLGNSDGSGAVLHHLAVGGRRSDPRFRDSGRYRDGSGS
jgi:Replication-relaxation